MHIPEAAHAFSLEGDIVSCKELGHGHINSTYKLTAGSGKEYVLQKINRYVFKDPALVMANASAVTQFLRHSVQVMLPDENTRRVGQSVAAASLPEIKR